MPGCSTWAHIGFAGEQRGSCSTSSRNVWYGPQHTSCASKASRTSASVRIMIVALTGGQWHALRAATGLDEGFTAVEHLLGVDLEREGDRFVAREQIGALLKPWVMMRTLAEVREAFDAHEVCWGPYQTFRELVEQDPRCSPANPMWAHVEQPGIGTYRMPASPVDT